MNHPPTSQSSEADDYLNQIWVIIDDTGKSRQVEAIVKQAVQKAVVAARIDELEALGQQHGLGTFITIASGNIQSVTDRLAELKANQPTTEGE